MGNDLVSIKVKAETKEKLDSIKGHPSQSYDSVVGALASNVASGALIISWEEGKAKIVGADGVMFKKVNAGLDDMMKPKESDIEE